MDLQLRLHPTPSPTPIIEPPHDTKHYNLALSNPDDLSYGSFYLTHGYHINKPNPRNHIPRLESFTMAQGDSERVREAQKLAKSNPKQAAEIYKDIISKPPSVNSDAAVKEYETALISLGELYRDQK